MKRDGANISAWQHHMPEYSAKTKKIPQQTFDVVIAGGGITGLTTALLLQKEGKSCLLAEAHTIGFGTTGGTTAHLNTMLDTSYSTLTKKHGQENARLVAKAAKDSLLLIKNLIKEYQIDCDHKELPGYLFAQTQDQCKELEEIYKASQEVGITLRYSSTIPVLVPFEEAIVFNDQAQFHPAKYIYALAKAFEDLGGILIQNCRVLHAEGKEILTIQSSLGKMQGRSLVYATHIPPGVNALHFECAPYRSYAIAAALEDDNYPIGLAYDMYDPYRYYRTQEIGNKKYLIFGGEDHKTGHEENTENCFRNLEAYLRKYYNVKEIAFKWSSQYFEPADGLPYIGLLPSGGKNVYVATGFSGNGMVYGTVAAFVLKDLIATGDNQYKELFDPSRISVIAGFNNIVKESADVVGHLVGDWFSIEGLESFSELAPGEAKIVKHDGKSIALYKDEDSKLHAVNPACTHIKCSVGWNATEKSWDCPCHGSRFAPDGSVLTAPARKALEAISLVEELNTVNSSSEKN